MINAGLNFISWPNDVQELEILLENVIIGFLKIYFTLAQKHIFSCLIQFTKTILKILSLLSVFLTLTLNIFKQVILIFL